MIFPICAPVSRPPRAAFRREDLHSEKKIKKELALRHSVIVNYITDGRWNPRSPLGEGQPDPRKIGSLRRIEHEILWSYAIGPCFCIVVRSGFRSVRPAKARSTKI